MPSLNSAIKACFPYTRFIFNVTVILALVFIWTITWNMPWIITWVAYNILARNRSVVVIRSFYRSTFLLGTIICKVTLFITYETFKIFLWILMIIVIFLILFLTLSCKMARFFTYITDYAVFEWSIALIISWFIYFSCLTLLSTVLFVKLFTFLSCILRRLIFIWTFRSNMTWFSTAVTDYCRSIIGERYIIIVIVWLIIL